MMRGRMDGEIEIVVGEAGLERCVEREGQEEGWGVKRVS